MSGTPRRRAGDGTGERLERAILDLLEQRAPGATICPSDAARAVGPKDGWRELMGPTRQAANRLAEAGRVVVTQRGEVVDIATARGPVRIRSADDGGAAGGTG